MQYLIGIDIGTSGLKAVLFNEKGDTIKSSTIEYPLYQPENGWAEQDPADWWNATKDCIRYIIQNSGIKNADIRAIGLSGQMHGLVMLDKKGDVLRRSILWCDQRTGRECEDMTRIVGYDKLIAITANPALTGFTASKILWVRKHEPEIYAQCAHILLPKDYIRYKLTGEFATEVSDASGMQLLDIGQRCWSDEILRLLQIDKSLLGKVYESPEVTGVIHAQAAEQTGLKQGTAVVGGAGDNAAAAVGTGVVRDGSAFTTIGTSGVVYAHTSKLTIEPKGRVHTFCCAVPGEWHVMGVTQGAGLSLQWFRNNFCESEKTVAKNLSQDPYTIMTSEAQNIPIGCERLIYLPYLMGERTPHLDPDCRGVFFGLSAIHTRPHLIRAVLEGIAYSMRDCFEILVGMDVRIKDMLICGGGSRSPMWCQMFSDVYECNIKTLLSNEGASLGAAILAGVGSGCFSTVQEACGALIKTTEPQQPIPANASAYKKSYAIYQQLYPALKTVYKDLKSI
jgi:xylulokinase